MKFLVIIILLLVLFSCEQNNQQIAKEERAKLTAQKLPPIPLNLDYANFDPAVKKQFAQRINYINLLINQQHGKEKLHGHMHN